MALKVLLVNTNTMKPPIAPVGLDYVADAVVAAGHSIRLCDLCFSEDVVDALNTAVADFSPDVVGLTVRNTDDCYFSGQAFFLPDIRDMVSAVRNATGAPVVLGGVGFSIMPESVMRFCGADCGIAGEGEEAFVRLLDALEGRCSWEDVPGLIYGDGSGGLRRNPQRFSDLSALGLRSRALADNARYFSEGGQAGFETKRGCNMQCIYCADPVAKGKHVRLRPPEMVVREIETLLAKGIDHFHTCDCEFNIPREHAVAVCRAVIDAGLGDRIRWYAYCAVTPFDWEMAELFRRAGCAGIDFGADSGSERILKSLGRHYSQADVLETARLCRENGITFMFDLLIGGPGETKDTVRETIEVMCTAEPDCVGAALGVRVYPGTPLAREIQRQGELESNPALYGAVKDNPDFLRPVFYISPEVGGEEVVGFVEDLVGGDQRFFLPSVRQDDSNYNYNDNTVLVRAIRAGARGAYWDILRRIRRCGEFGSTND